MEHRQIIIIIINRNLVGKTFFYIRSVDLCAFFFSRQYYTYLIYYLYKTGWRKKKDDKKTITSEIYTQWIHIKRNKE